MTRARQAVLSLVLGGLALSACVLADADENPKLLVRLQSTGGGMVLYYRTFELFTDGTLEMARTTPTGGLLERRRARLSRESATRYEEALQSAGYMENSDSVLTSTVVREILAESEDLPSWKVQVFPEAGGPALAFVPSPSMERYHPELRQIPFVTAAWQLVTDFTASWERAEQVAP